MTKMTMIALIALTAISLSGQETGIQTDRPQGRDLKLPRPDPAWQFVVFGDRTGGPASGVKILAEAVDDANLLRPDLVMTVGDLIQGYNTTTPWLRQMREYREIMDRLEAPWFPVAGNHDIYWRGKNRPDQAHEANYEKHFGPLWYWFPHKNAAFIVLYSDEGDPESKSKGFRRQRHVQFSRAQMSWLRKSLKATSAYEHCFVFLHHPRWRSDYYEKSNWPRVARMLERARNVRAVFAGHMHELRYNRTRRGIELFTLGATGGGLNVNGPKEAGFRHHYEVITVKNGCIGVASYPVGAALDPRQLDNVTMTDMRTLIGSKILNTKVPLDLGLVLKKTTPVVLSLENPSNRSITVTLESASDSVAWSLAPAVTRVVLEPQQKQTVTINFTLDHRLRQGGFPAPRLKSTVSYQRQAQELVFSPEILDVPCTLKGDVSIEDDGVDRALVLDKGACVRLDHDDFTLPDGPFTIEGFFWADQFEKRQPLVAKTENSEWSLFADNGLARFSVHIDGAYRNASMTKNPLEAHRWHHLAGVYDGKEVRLYVNGKLVDTTPAKGTRTTNGHPVFIGADPDRRGRPVNPFRGRIDKVRLSKKALYHGGQIRVPRRLHPDNHTIFLFDFDTQVGPLHFDRSQAQRLAHSHGTTRTELRRAQ